MERIEVGCPRFDSDSYYLGTLCRRQHEWGTTSKSLRSGKDCYCCAAKITVEELINRQEKLLQAARAKDLPGEIWRSIEGYDGLYEVSNLARIRSIKNNLILEEEVMKLNYRRVCLQNGSRNKVLVHRLVALAFIGEPPTPMHTDVNHIDGDVSNNLPSNLEWTTHQENVTHAMDVLGRRSTIGVRREQHHQAKLNQKLADEIKLLKGLMSGTKVAAMYGVTYTTVYDIWKGERWS
jgi:hypothetical protein